MKSIMIFATICIPLTVLWALPAGATTYYVANAGNDNCNGSSQTIGISGSCAWKTINRVNGASFVPGDLVLFRQGDTWRERLNVRFSGAPGSPITLGAYGSGANPVISAYDLVTTWSLYRSGSTVYHAPVSTRPDRVFWGNVELTLNSGHYHTLSSKQWDYYSGALYVNIGKNPSGETIEATQRNYAIGASVVITDISIQNLHLIGNLGSSYAAIYFKAPNSHRIIVSNCTIERAGGAGIVLNGSNWTVTRNTITDTMSNGITADCHSQSGGTFSYNDVSNAGNGGAIEVTIQGATFSHNILHDRKSNGINYGQPHHGFYVYWYLTGAAGNTFEYNEIYGFSNSSYGDSGMRLEGNNNIVRYNKFHDNYYAMYDIDTDGSNIGNQIYYNLFYNNYHPIIEIDGAQNNRFYNNVFDSILQFGAGSYQTCSGNAVENNIFYSISGYGLLAVASGQGAGLVSDYNLFFPTSGNLFDWLGTSLNFSQWTYTSGRDLHSINANPLFVNAPGGDFHLLPGSPAVYAGTNVGLTEDFDGKPVPLPGASRPSIGAYEP